MVCLRVRDPDTQYLSNQSRFRISFGGAGLRPRSRIVLGVYLADPQNDGELNRYINQLRGALLYNIITALIKDKNCREDKPAFKHTYIQSGIQSPPPMRTVH